MSTKDISSIEIFRETKPNSKCSSYIIFYEVFHSLESKLQERDIVKWSPREKPEILSIKPPLKLFQKLKGEYLDLRKVKYMFKDLREFKKVPKQAREDIICRYREIIYDYKGYYVPYGYTRKEDWGIYLRIGKINKQFNEILEKFWKYLGINNAEKAMALWDTLCTIVFWHEFAHYIVDSALILKGATNLRLPREEEEGFCEWLAFTLTEIPIVPFMLINLLSTKKGKYLNKGFRMKVLNVLYYYWKRENDPVYNPRVSKNIFTKVIKDFKKLIRYALTIKEGKCIVECHTILPHPIVYLTTL